jgi:hypothetical protein
VKAASMSVASILLPVFVQIALTFVLLVRMGTVRVASLKHGKVKLRDVALNQNNWPPDVMQVGNSLNNQFQLPVLFYVLTGLALFTRKADLLFVILSWVFVISRIVHAGIHITSNNVTQRFAAYTVGLAILLLMWVIFAVQILLVS